MLAEIFTPQQITILSQIIFIDLVLAGDNAIIIGMVASKFPVEQRKKIIFWGIGGAVVLRIILTLLTAFLLQISGLRLIGGVLLLYIVYKLYVDVIKGSDHDDNIEIDNSNFLKAIWTVLLADFTMSLDNVLGVAGAAGDHYGLLVFGLVLSIILMATAATLISNWIKKYKWIAWAGLFAILIVYLVLSAQFESFKNPLTIMFTVPIALTAGLYTLFLTGTSLNVYSQIGFLMLIGLIAKNGILVVEFANQLRNEGYSIDDAIIESSLTRLRPVLMTTISTLLGAIPLVLSSGAGAESRYSMAIVVFGGITLSALITLYLIPALYRFIESK